VYWSAKRVLVSPQDLLTDVVAPEIPAVYYIPEIYVGLHIDKLINAIQLSLAGAKAAKPAFLEFYGISGTEFETLSYYGKLVYMKFFCVIKLGIVKERLICNHLLFYMKRVFSFVAPVNFRLGLFIYAFHCLYIYRCFQLPLYFFSAVFPAVTFTNTHTHTNIYIYIYLFLFFVCLFILDV
jgi:hypothetical protein